MEDSRAHPVAGDSRLVVLLVIAGLAGLVVVQSGWFHEYVRQRIIAEIEHATGGRVEIGRFSFRGPTLTASVARWCCTATKPRAIRLCCASNR